VLWAADTATSRSALLERGDRGWDGGGPGDDQFPEKAPGCPGDLFLAAMDRWNRLKATGSLLSTGRVPGTVARAGAGQRRYGRLPLAAVIAPAIAWPKDGNTWVSPRLAGFP